MSQTKAANNFESILGADVTVAIGGVLIGGQQGLTVNRSADTLETTHKGTGRWRTRRSGLKEWSVDFDGLLPVNDAGYAALEEAFHSGEPVTVTVATPANTFLTGEAYCVDFPLEAGFEDLMTYSVSLEGASGLEPITGTEAE